MDEKRILEQFHFYLCNNNLAKDKFLKEKVLDSKEGWIPLDLFLNFNKIKEITTDKSILVNALEKSDLLQLNENKTQIRRKEPYIDREIAPEYVIYVENISPHWDREFVKSLFEPYGKVNLVSMPKTKKSNHHREYAFVEFEEKESVLKALALNGHIESSWINPLLVMSKLDWIIRKEQYKKEFIHAERKKSISTETIAHIPLLYVQNLIPYSSNKMIRSIMSVYGKIGYLDIYHEENTHQHKLITPSSCILQFSSTIYTERCLLVTRESPIYMDETNCVSIRMLNEEEEDAYWRFVKVLKRDLKDKAPDSKRVHIT